MISKSYVLSSPRTSRGKLSSRRMIPSKGRQDSVNGGGFGDDFVQDVLGQSGVALLLG